MNDVEVLLDLLDDFMKSTHKEIEGLTHEVLTWKPDPEANSIAVTLWHVGRWMDILGTRILQGRLPEDEQWHLQGWAERTGYDPRGIGFMGLGAITGYTLQEAAAVPELTGDDLLTYVDQTYTVTKRQLQAMSSEMLYEPVRDGTLEGTVYDWLKRLLRGFLGHIGEVQALRAMDEKARKQQRQAQQEPLA